MKQKFIEWFTKNNNGCSPAMEDDRSYVHEKTQHMFEAYQAGVAEGEARCAALAAENAGLKAEVPMGAIVNGRAFADRLEAYPFECQGGNLNMCSDWQELIRCFEHLSEWAMRGQPETPATDAFLAEVRAQGVEMAVDVVKQCYDNICAGGLQENREYEESIVQPHLDGIDDELKEIIAQLRKGAQS